MGFIRCRINDAPSSAGLQGLLIEAAADSRYAMTAIAFYRVSAPAGLLLVPYLLWLSFAIALMRQSGGSTRAQPTERNPKNRMDQARFSAS